MDAGRERDRPRSIGTGTGPLVAVLVAAAAFRLWLLTTPALRLDGDEAVTGLLARRILEGHHRAYFPGQDYMGTGEQYLQAAVLWALPDTDLVLRLPQVGLAVLACFLVHRLALRCGLSARRALLAATLFAAGPYFAVAWGVKSRGAYSTALLLGLGALLVALWVTPDDPRRLPKVALFGCIAGAALWSNQQAAYLIVPAAWWLLATLKGRWPSSALAGAAGFVVGALPALWHTLAGGPGPFVKRAGATSVAERAQFFVTETLPDLLGLRDDGKPLVAWLPPAFVVLVVVAVVGVAVSRHRDALLAIVRLRIDGRHGVALLLLALVVLPLLYVQSGVATEATAQYAFVLYAVLPVLVAALPTPTTWIREPADATVAGVLLVVAFALHTVVGAAWTIGRDDGGREAAAGQVVVPEDLGAVVDALVAAGAHTAYADYWLANPLTWEADGRVVVDALFTRRFPDISAAVEADPSPALVVAHEEVGDLRDALAERGATYDVQLVRDWGVFTGIEPGVHLPWTNSVVEAVRAAP
jgi:hypothetical protein